MSEPREVADELHQKAIELSDLVASYGGGCIVALYVPDDLERESLMRYAGNGSVPCQLGLAQYVVALKSHDVINGN